MKGQRAEGSEPVKIAVFYVGTSLLAPLRRAESDIKKRYSLNLQIAAHNCGAPLDRGEWLKAETDISNSEIVFIVHVTDDANASLIAKALDKCRDRHSAVIGFNCMPDLMRRTRMGKLDFSKLMKSAATTRDEGRSREVSSESLT